MARLICTGCQQPESTCLCPFILSASHNTRVWIIQCGKETQHPKNTANLLPQLSDNIELIHDSDTEALARLRAHVLNNRSQTIVLFPDESAEPLYCFKEPKETLTVTDLLLIDGTWRKAKRFIFENTWLESIPKGKLSKDYESRYHIRKTKVDNGLSTLEATAYALFELENIDTKPFLHLLEGINTVFTKHMPAEVKKRY